MKKGCIGCISIRKGLFPFRWSIEVTSKKSEVVNSYIDQEGCGLDGRDSLKIYFCPVCGRKLKNEKR